MFLIPGRGETTKSRWDLINARGFTIIEILVVIFVIGTVVVGLFGLFLLSMRTAQGNENRIVAVALANERMEMVRNLPYIHVGTVGGIPPGSLEQEEIIEHNNVPYTVKTNIVYVDDPFDGLGEDDPINTDYKQVRIEVTWPSVTQVSPVLLITIVAPPGVEGGEVAGTLSLQVLNSEGLGVSNADVRLVNNNVNPPVDYQTQTNNEGKVLIPGLKESIEGYELEVSKSGYITKKTFDKTSTFFPDADHSHLTALPGVLTEKTFSIDLVSQLSLRFIDEEGEAVPNVSYRLRGGKVIGIDDDENTVYSFDTLGSVDGDGLATHSNLEWDNYHLFINGGSTGYDIKYTNFTLPAALDVNETKELIVTLVPHTPISLHVTVTSLGNMIENASIKISRGETEETLVTGPLGQVLFSDLQEEGNYNVEISAPGYVTSEIIIDVAGTQRESLELVPE